MAIGHTKKYGSHLSEVLPLQDWWQCQGYPQSHMRGTKLYHTPRPTYLNCFTMDNRTRVQLPGPSYPIAYECANLHYTISIALSSSISSNWPWIYSLHSWLDLAWQLWFIVPSWCTKRLSQDAWLVFINLETQFSLCRFEVINPQTTIHLQFTYT